MFRSRFYTLRDEEKFKHTEPVEAHMDFFQSTSRPHILGESYTL